MIVMCIGYVRDKITFCNDEDKQPTYHEVVHYNMHLFKYQCQGAMLFYVIFFIAILLSGCDENMYNH